MKYVDWNKIEKNFPVSFIEFWNFLLIKRSIPTLLLSDICYCDVLEFFNTNGMILNIVFNKRGYWYNVIYIENPNIVYTSTIRLYDIQEIIKGKKKHRQYQKAAEAIIYEAFKMLNDELFIDIEKQRQDLLYWIMEE